MSEINKKRGKVRKHQQIVKLKEKQSNIQYSPPPFVGTEIVFPKYPNL